MKVLVIGAHGQVGQQLVRDLSAQGEEVYAGIRNMAQTKDFADDVHVVALDVTGPIADMTRAMNGMDAVIFAAGSGGKTGDDMTLRVDLDGAIKSMQAAGEAKIGKYVLISALYADKREQWPTSILPYYVAKYYSEEWLKRESGLNYLIIQPSTLLNEPARGTIAVTMTRPPQLRVRTWPRQLLWRCVRHQSGVPHTRLSAATHQLQKHSKKAAVSCALNAIIDCCFLFGKNIENKRNCELSGPVVYIR